MRHTHQTDLNQDTAVTIGNFDGLHRGHQPLLQKAKEYARQYQVASLAFSFSPHPASVLSGKAFCAILSSVEKRLLLEESGLDIFLEYPFDQDFSQMDPEHFLELLFYRLRCKALVVGEGYRFGRNRSGTAALLRERGEQEGIAVSIIPHVYDLEENCKISSSRIRELILQGAMAKARHLLGRPYFMMEEVLKGRKVGRTLGFPTVNLVPPPQKILPPNGVYATSVYFPQEGSWWLGVTNVGNNPTVKPGDKTVETYIFDFNREVYGKKIQIYFYEKLRDEVRFDSLEQLKAQIERDAHAARKSLGALSLGGGNF